MGAARFPGVVVTFSADGLDESNARQIEKATKSHWAVITGGPIVVAQGECWCTDGKHRIVAQTSTWSRDPRHV